MPPESRGSKRQFNELPTPKERVSMQLYNELLRNRGRFVRKEMAKMERQNTYLTDLFIIGVMQSPDTELSLDWGLLYYAIHSRSTGRKDMPKVSKELTDAKFKERTQVLESEGHQKLLRELEAQNNRLIEVDRQRGAELDMYWQLLNDKEANLKDSGRYTPDGVEDIFRPVYMLAGLLRSQTATNRLRNQIPGV